MSNIIPGIGIAGLKKGSPMLRAMTPRRALLLSLGAGLLTMVLKSAAWYVTGSVAYLSDAVESLINIAGAGFALLMVTYALRPADDGHPFGHGKAEYFSAAFEGGMILAASLAIIAAAVERLLHPQPLQTLGLGTTLSVVASLVNLGTARVLFSSAKHYRSPALEADGKHLMTDVWTTAGVIIGVGLAAVSGQYWIDALVAIIVALHILHQGARLLVRATGGLMDSALQAERISEIQAVMLRFENEGVQFANLKTRAAGNTHFATFEMRVPGHWSVQRAHQLADEVEAAMSRIGVSAVAHMEPLAS
jgi:cation diffusion facilitator family transporter